MPLRLLLLACLATWSSCVTVPRPSVHRGFPPECVSRPALQFVKMPTPPTAEERAWAQDFGTAYGLSVSWGESVDLPPAVTTTQGSQLVAEELIATLDARQPKVPPSTIVVGLTDRDLFIRGKSDWYWAFGLYQDQTAVISTAHMEAEDPRFHGRLSKHLARVLGSIVCGLPRTGPPRSEMRVEVGGLADLDEIDESNWELRAPVAAKPGQVDHHAVEEQLVQTQALIRQKEPEQAIALAQKIIAQYEAAYAGKLVYCAVNMQQTLYYSALAAEQKKDGVVLDSIWALAWFFKGFALADLKRYVVAEAALERAVGLSPKNAKFLSELGFVQQSQQKPLVAIKTFERALEAADLADEPERDSLRARARRGIGFNQIELGDLDGAEKSFLEALKLVPGDPGATGELKYIDQQRRKGPVHSL